MRAKYSSLIPTFTLLSLLAVLSALTPNIFSEGTANVFFRSIVPYGIIAIGLYPVMASRYIDLSQFAVADFIGTVIIVSLNASESFFIFIPLVLLIGSLIGLVNGIVVARVRVHPILATYCMSLIIKGVMFIITKGRMVRFSEQSFLSLGRGDIFGIPIPLIILFLVFFIVMYIIHHTILGRQLIASGSNTKASYFSGIQVENVQAIAFIISGACAALAGLVFVSISGSVATGLDLSVNLSAVIIVVLGGTDLYRRGSPFGIFFGLLLFYILEKGLIHYGIMDYYHSLIKGIVLLVVILINYCSHEFRRTRRNYR